MKKLLLAVPMVGSVVTAFAEGSAPSAGPEAYSGSVAETVVNNASTTLINFIEGAGVVVAAVIVAGLAIWGAIALVGILKRAFQTGKGR